MPRSILLYLGDDILSNTEGKSSENEPKQIKTPEKPNSDLTTEKPNLNLKLKSKPNGMETKKGNKITME